MNAEATARRAAIGYDRWFEGPRGRYAFAVERRALVRALPPLSGAHVLDAGCGTGRFTAVLELHGAHTVGVDTDAARLDVAARRLRGSLAVADAAHLPFPDAVFDHAVAVTLLEFVPDPVAVLAELARVTRPGGRVVVCALNPRSPWGWAHHDRLKLPPWNTARFLTRRQLRTLAGPYGPAHLHGVLLAPGPLPGLRRLGPLLEPLGRACPALGAFQVLALHTAAEP